MVEGDLKGVIRLDDGDRIVLARYDIHGPKTQENLVRLRPDGTVVWRAEPPKPSAGDSWMTVERVPNGGLIANSWSCWRVRIDPTTGKTVDKEFTK